MRFVEQITRRLVKAKNHPSFKGGDTVSVSVKVTEGAKERIQIFKGTVLKVRGEGSSRTFTVRKVSDGVGVERTFPFNSPSVEQIKVDARGKVRQSRIFYLRKLKGRASRIEVKQDFQVSVKKSESSKKKPSSKAKPEEENKN